jgi:hypothetical protein
MNETLSSISYETERWASVAATTYHCDRVIWGFKHARRYAGQRARHERHERRVGDPIDLTFRHDDQIK